VDATELCFTPATELAARIRRKELSPVEVFDAFAARIEALNPKLNAFCTLVLDRAREEARQAEAAVVRGDPLGPIHGLPVGIKDLVPTAGIRTTFGSKLYAENVPQADAEVVRRIRAAGGIIVGKTTTPEFGHKGVTDSPLFGVTRNPWNLDRTPGGSSGGAGAAVAAGMVPLADGSDGGGSIRIPASFCGIFGHKPSYGLVSRAPTLDYFTTLSHLGPMTRTVADGVLFLKAMAGYDYKDPYSLPFPAEQLDGVLAGAESLKGVKIAWSPDLGYAPVEPEVLDLTRSAVAAFEELGAVVEEANPGFENPLPAFEVLFNIFMAERVICYLPDRQADIDPTLLKIVERALGFTAVDYGKAQIRRSRLYEQCVAFFEKYDLLLTPTMPMPAFEVGVYPPKLVGGVELDESLGWTPFTFPFNLTNQPAASVPAGWTRDGLPVGLQIVGGPRQDLLVLRAAAAFERVRPWAHRRPPVD
jgi:Asp-tRNA(Asn)/Glu-tRNA(Gln) amidotransferase A subunit family amidase